MYPDPRQLTHITRSDPCHVVGSRSTSRILGWSRIIWSDPYACGRIQIRLTANFQDPDLHPKCNRSAVLLARLLINLYLPMIRWTFSLRLRKKKKNIILPQKLFLHNIKSVLSNKQQHLSAIVKELKSLLVGHKKLKNKVKTKAETTVARCWGGIIQTMSPQVWIPPAPQRNFKKCPQEKPL